MRTEKELLQGFKGIEARISRISLYLRNVHAVSQFSFGVWNSRQHVLLAIEAEGEVGFAESIVAVNQPKFDLAAYGREFAELRGCGISEALEKVRARRGLWQERLTELLEMALLDLVGKYLKRPTLRLLGLLPEKSVYGVSVILSSSVKEVEQKAKEARERNRAKFLKLKLFGEVELDQSLILAVRQVCSKEESYLIGDVNGGYCQPNEKRSVRELADKLRILYEAGLNACEDPAYISNKEWVSLQEACGALCLIPDYPLRPARQAIHTILPGMGRIYNVHPATMGSLIDAVLLVEKIKAVGARVMIGDDSLVGPAATVWQQLAMGLGAEWVEAVEKEGDSDFFCRAVVDLATDSRCFPISYKEKNGFGIELNEEILREEAEKVLE